ncbi:MAG: phage tail protein [Anaerolineae bacterium]
MPWLRQDMTNIPNLGDKGGSLGLTDTSFQLLVEGKVTGLFYRLWGGEIAVGAIGHDITFESGASTTLLIPSTTSFAPFTLSRGFANYMELFNWLMQASNGDIINARRDGTIKLRRPATNADVQAGLAQSVGDQITKVQWHFYSAWPTKLESFGTMQKEGTVSTIARVNLTLAAETIEFEEPV